MDPPPAPTLWMSSMGRMIGISNSSSYSRVTSPLPSSTIDTSKLVPPMSAQMMLRSRVVSAR